MTIGYGYLPYRAAALFGLILLAGVVGFSLFPPWPIGPGGLRPAFNPFFYTLDVLIPFANFGQREIWLSSVGQEMFKIFLAILGWTLAATALAGFTRTLTRS